MFDTNEWKEEKKKEIENLNIEIKTREQNFITWKEEKAKEEETRKKKEEDKRRNEAASKIQYTYRRYMLRKFYKELDNDREASINEFIRYIIKLPDENNEEEEEKRKKRNNIIKKLNGKNLNNIQKLYYIIINYIDNDKINKIVNFDDIDTKKPDKIKPDTSLKNMKIQYKIYLDNINNTFKNKNKIEDDSDLLSKFTQMKTLLINIYMISISIKTKNTAESLSSFIKSIYYLIRDVNNGLQEMKESLIILY